MTINTISNTVASALEVHGVSSTMSAPYVTPVIEALTERDYQITETIISTLVDNNLVNEEDALFHAERLGLSVRPQPEPEVEEEEEEEVTEEVEAGDMNSKLEEILAGLTGISTRIEKLENAASRNGISL